MQTLKAYFAGLFDGEGCILLSKKKRHTGSYYYLQAHLSMTHKPTIDRLAFCYSGTVYKRKRGNWKTQYDWCANSTDAYNFIRDIRPYCITKAEEIDAAIDYHEHSDPSYHNSRNQDRSSLEAYGEHTKLLLSALKTRDWL